MTTNLHDKMLAAIDAYFSASDGDERDQAEEQLLDVRDEINKHKLAEQPAQHTPPSTFTTGHCKEKAKEGGCQLHNIQCGFPACDRKEA